METRFFSPRNDFAFKRLFGSEDHKDLLISFLNGVLKFENNAVIEDIEFLDPFQAPKIYGSKQSILDILCKDQNGSRYIVEIQVAHTPDFQKRAQYYAAKTYVTQLRKAQKYPGLKKVIFLAISDYIIFKDKKHYKSEHLILDTKTHENDLQDFCFTFIELPKFNKEQENLETFEDKWIYFLKHADMEREIPDLFEGTPIEKAYHVLERYMWNEQEIRAYEDIEIAIVDNESRLEHAEAKGRAEGEAKGEAKGILEGKIDLACTLLKEGINIDILIKTTGLTKEQILSNDAS